MKSMSEQVPKKSMKKKIGYGVLIYLGIIIGLVLLLALLADIYGETPTSDPYGDGEFSQIAEQDRALGSGTGNLIPEWAPVLGSTDAKVTIIEFSDFQCPFCRASMQPIKQILQENQGDVRLVYRHLPLTSVHPLANELAHAAMCVHEQGEFWKVHDLFFINQDQITSSEDITDQVRKVGVNMNQYFNCQSSKRWQDAIDQDRSEAISRGGRGTPTWLINGQLLQGVIPISSWQKIIDELR